MTVQVHGDTPGGGRSWVAAYYLNPERADA